MRVRLRKDLKVTQRQQGLDVVWVLKDPVAFTHFQFSEHEYSLARLFDGQRSLDEVVSDWQRKFRSTSLNVAQVRAFVQKLMSDNLVVVDRSGYGALLCAKDRGRKNGKWWMNPLAIRFRGVNPNGLLKELDWFAAVLFHPVGMVTVLLMSLTTLLFLLGNFESVAERIPKIEYFLSNQGLIGLIISVALIKMLHELGHAMACRRYGAECLEIGVMLLALIPTLYCNVSDAWSINERWKRMVVSAAGMYVEIGLASVAAILWMLTPPGLLNALLFNVVMLCSLNTVLVNGNPLLRYDGYYLLSDWVERPNLSEHAKRELVKLTSGLTRSFSGEQQYSRQIKIWLLSYAVLAFFYRWIVIGVILLALISFASLWQAQTMGIVLACVLLMAMMAGRSKAKRMAGETKVGQFSWIRTSLSIFVGTVLLWFVLMVPIPKSVYCDFEVGLVDATPVFSPNDGRLVGMVDLYETVQEGDTVATLENPEIRHRFEMTRLRLDRAKNQLKLLESRVNEAPEIATEIEVAQKNVAAARASLVVHQRELELLNVVAPSSGVIYPAPERVSQASFNDFIFVPGDRVSDPVNESCLVWSSEHLLSIVAPENREVIMFVDENDMDFIEEGQRVRLMFYRIPGFVVAGRVIKIFEDDLGINESDDARTDPPEGGFLLERKKFRVIVEVQQLPVKAVSGSMGRAKISVSSQSIAIRFRRMITRAMNTRL